MDSNWQNYVHTEDTLKIYQTHGTWKSEIKPDDLFKAFVNFGMNSNLHYAFQYQILNSNACRRWGIMAEAWGSPFLFQTYYSLRDYTHKYRLKNVKYSVQF